MKPRTIVVTLILATFGFSSCNTWLELEPEDGVIRERFWKTKEEALSALLGCYTSMMEDNVLTRYFVWGEMRADMVEPTPDASASLTDIRNGEISSSNEYTTWGEFYRTINQCNTVIELAPQVLKKDMSFSDKTLHQYVAEATCVRTLAYFYLLRAFRDVPYVTRASIYDDQNYSPAKMPQAQLVDSLIACLENIDARNALPESYNDLVFTKGRFTRWGMKTLLADIYLWKGDYEKCVQQCNQIIGSGQYSLVPVSREQLIQEDVIMGKTDTIYIPSEGDVTSLFDKMYVKGNSVESILELQFGTDKNNPWVKWFRPVYAYLQPNMANMQSVFFPTSEIDGDYYDIRSEGVSYKQGYIWKWIGLSRDVYQYRDVNASFSNWIFYRLADVYLMKAEALTQQAILEGNNQDKLQDAHALVQQIRERANAPESTDMLYKQTGDIDGKLLESFILAERAREFAFEGKRWFDVLRHAKRDNYSDENISYLEQVATIGTLPEKISTLQNKWLNNYESHYLPIHIEELKRNKNLVQLPFYN